MSVELYVRRFDGWGAWASAPILLVPGIISLAIVVPALFDCFAGARARTLRPETVVLTVVSGIPLLWLGLRRFLL